ncbi:MAG: hypothetical protein RLZZ127_219 [Planctomycetota bacterium]|jgi:altronate hydrolase
MPSILRIHPHDDVAVALADLPPGAEIGPGLRVREPVPRGHKVALHDIAAGNRVVKYGYPIGTATAAIAGGAHVHAHNLATALGGAQDYRFAGPAKPARSGRPPVAAWQGYRRADGRWATRNELWIIPTVGCVARTAEALAEAARARLDLAGIDGVHAFVHPFGCSQLGDDLRATQQVLAGLAQHPNAAGVLVLGLGCENNHLGAFRQVLGPVDPDRVAFLSAQASSDEIEEGLAILARLAARAARARREPADIAELVVGLKCGGSDGLSGITANPLLGRFCDTLCHAGGSAILTEVPEMFGAETMLMERCADRAAFESTVKMVNGFKEYFERHGQPVYENPSPGNKAGGITTLEEKSLGCTQKAGDAVVTDVIPYAHPVRERGLTLLDGPGNDLVAVTNLAAAGATLVLFTTGRGTPLGGPVPVVKIATNSDLARRKPGWIDVDAGVLAEGADATETDAGFLESIIAHASGLATRAEQRGHREMAILKGGVTL